MRANSLEDAVPERARHPLVPSARDLRATSTDAERALWKLLRSRQLASAKFRRQQPLGPYILDFYCIEKRLAVEADGGQHYSPDGIAEDARRTAYPEQHGIRMLRFSNREILLERDAVLAAIEKALDAG